MKGKHSSVVWTEQVLSKAVNSCDKTKYTSILEARLGNFLENLKS